MPPTALGKRHLPKTMGDVQASNLIRLPGPTEASPLPGSSHTLYQQEPLLPPQVPAGSCMEFGANTTVHDTTRPALPRFGLRRALAVHGKEADSPELKRPRVSEECESTRCPCVSGTTEYRPVDAYLGWIRLAIENLIVSPREEEQSSCSASPMMHAGWLTIATAKYPS